VLRHEAMREPLLVARNGHLALAIPATTAPLPTSGRRRHYRARHPVFIETSYSAKQLTRTACRYGSPSPCPTLVQFVSMTWRRAFFRCLRAGTAASGLCMYAAVATFLETLSAESSPDMYLLGAHCLRDGDRRVTLRYLRLTNGRPDGRAMDGHHVDRPVHDLEQLDAVVVHLFAGPYVTVGAERREVPEGSKQLLAFVSLRRRRVERRQAAGSLWPFGDEERAAGNLRSALWRLRRAGINVLVADKWSLALNTNVLVDLHLMEQWAARLIEGRPAGRDLTVSSWVTDALDLLPGFYDDWALMERERIRQRILHALEALSERLAAAGRFADAVEAAMLATSAEPLRESAQRTLIKAHIAEGNLTEARRSYRAYHDLVHRELGVTLSDDFSAGLGIPEARPSLAGRDRVALSPQGASAAHR